MTSKAAWQTLMPYNFPRPVTRNKHTPLSTEVSCSPNIYDSKFIATCVLGLSIGLQLSGPQFRPCQGWSNTGPLPCQTAMRPGAQRSALSCCHDWDVRLFVVLFGYDARLYYSTVRRMPLPYVISGIHFVSIPTVMLDATIPMSTTDTPVFSAPLAPSCSVHGSTSLRKCRQR